MRQWIRRLAAAFSLLLLLTACSSGQEASKASQLAMTVAGHEVEVGTYAANYLYSKAGIENMMYQYGITDLWDSEIGSSYKEHLGEIARSQTASLYLVPDQFAAAGLTLTDEDRQSAGEPNPNLKEMGFTDSLIDQFTEYYTMLDKLDAYYFGENGVMVPEESEIENYFQQNYMRAKHVLISAMDENNQPITDEGTLAELEATAQEVYRRAAGGEDFDALIAEYGQDPGTSSSPDGYQFTDGEMVTEFQEAVKALEMNGISEPVKSDYGWHIIQRLPLLEEGRASVFGNIVTALTGMSMDSLLDQWVNEAEITEEAVLSEITFDNVDNYKYSVS